MKREWVDPEITLVSSLADAANDFTGPYADKSSKKDVKSSS